MTDTLLHKVLEQVATQQAAQQAPAKQRLHVTPAVGNDEDDNVIPHHPIDEAIRLEEHLAVVLDPEIKQLSRVTAALRHDGQLFGRDHQPIQNMISVRGRIKLGDVIVDRLQIPFGTIGQQDAILGWHQAWAFLALSRATTSDMGLILPADTSCWPKASTFNRARVSCVAS